jgi:hypothetical protein
VDRIGFNTNTNPDPAFYVSADPDPDPGSKANADPVPDPGQIFAVTESLMLT